MSVQRMLKRMVEGREVSTHDETTQAEPPLRRREFNPLVLVGIDGAVAIIPVAEDSVEVEQVND